MSAASAPLCVALLACSGSDTNGGPVVLVSGARVLDLAVDETSVYWIDGEFSALRKVSNQGGQPATLSSDPLGSEIAVNGRNVYVTDVDGIVTKVPAAGGAPEELISDPKMGCLGAWRCTATDGTDVFWQTDGGSGALATGVVMKMSVDGGPPTRLVSGLNRVFEGVMVASGSAVYFANGKKISRVPTSGDQHRMMAVPFDSGRSEFAVRRGGVYFASCSNGTVRKATLDGTVTRIDTIAAGLDCPGTVLADAANVYWVDTNQASQASSIMKAPLDGGTPTALVSAQSAVHALAIDATNVYWVNGADGMLRKVPRVGGTPTVLAKGLKEAAEVAVDGSSVYVAISDLSGAPNPSGSIVGVPLEGGPVTTLATGVALPSAMSVAAGYVVWSDYGPVPNFTSPPDAIRHGSIMKVAVGGGTPTAIASELPAPIARVEGSNVYWSISTALDDTVGNVVMAPVEGGEPVTVATGIYCTEMILEPPSAYCLDANSKAVVQFPLSGDGIETVADGAFPDVMGVNRTDLIWADPGSIERAPLAGGEPMAVASPSDVFSVAFDDTSVYWTTLHGDIMKAPLAGGAAQSFATGVGARRLAVDATSLYWAGFDDTISKLTPK